MGDEEKGYLKKNILGMSFTSLLTDVASESVYAVLPFYILGLGYGREIVGLIEGLGELTSSIFKFLSGYIAERINKYKMLALLGYALSTFAKPFFALARTWPVIAAIKVVDRLGKGIRTSPRDTLIAASSSSKYRGRAFGLHRAMDTVGATIGPLLAALLLPLIGFTGIFLFSLIPGLAAVLILYIFVEDVKMRKTKEQEIIGRLPGIYWLFIATIALTGLSGYTQAFLLVRASELGWSEESSILLLTMANIFYAVLAYPVGYLSDVASKKFNPYPFMFVVMIAGTIAISLSMTMIHAVIFFILFGVYMAFHDTLIRIMTSRLVTRAQRARAYGIMHGTYGLSALIGYYIVGYIYQYIGIHYAFTYATIIGLIGLLLSIILVSRTTRG